MKTNFLQTAVLISLIVLTNLTINLSGQGFNVVFYNTENLYDTIDQKEVQDSQFLPDSRIAWDSERYQKKLSDIAKVLTAIDPRDYPSLIGLCEVENRKVLADLTGQEEMKDGNYGIVHYNSPDRRGIDVALLYRQNDFTVLSSRSVPVVLTNDTLPPSRDILYVKGVINKHPKDTLHVFVNHWPSRRNGMEATEQSRMDAARCLRQVTDSLLSLKQASNILVMGDFNDEPGDKSLKEGLNAKFPGEGGRDKALYNLMEKPYTEGKGTLYFEKWQIFDQILVSKNLLDKEKGLMLPEPEGKIFEAEWLLYTPDDGEPRPNRTIGARYYGGYSDHLPVYVEFKVK